MRHLNGAQALLRHARVAEAFASWLGDDRCRLVAAAELLGGERWRARAAAVVDAIASGEPLVEHLDEFRALRSLLHLELTDDIVALEAALFADVHPDDPRADNARICAEALDRGVQALSALSAAGRGQQEAA